MQGRANSFQPQGLGPNPISLRPILPRCASRTGLMVAAQAVSLGWRANAGLLRAPAMAAMSLSTQAQQSTSPKPGFAPGAPAPGTPAAAPPAPPPKPPAGGVPPPPPGRRPILPGPEKELPKSKWSALGWAIPLIGLPVLAAAYNYQQVGTIPGFLPHCCAACSHLVHSGAQHPQHIRTILLNIPVLCMC